MTRRRVVDIYRYVLRPTLECKPGRGHCILFYMHFIRKRADSENVDYCFCEIIVVGEKHTQTNARIGVRFVTFRWIVVDSVGFDPFDP